jgi:hypothetical protein
METKQSFRDHAVVSCGTLRPELEHLRDTGFLDADAMLFTAPGLHENCPELARQLRQRVDEAGRLAPRVIVLYGDRCYIDTQDPERTIDRLLAEQGGGISRIDAGNCVDMLVGREQRDHIAGGDELYWLTPGWLRYWKAIFRHWDAGKANETFPRDGKAILLDGLGTYDDYLERAPEKLLEFSDWMRIPIVSYEITLDRLKGLLVQQIRVRPPRSAAPTSPDRGST